MSHAPANLDFNSGVLIAAAKANLDGSAKNGKIEIHAFWMNPLITVSNSK